MENLYSFLIGLGFPLLGMAVIPMIMIAGGAKPGEPAKAMAWISVAGIVAWVVIFVAWGFVAGLIAFAGWIVGLPVAAGALMAVYKARKIANERTPALGFNPSGFRSPQSAQTFSTRLKTRIVRLESTTGCPRCPIYPAEPFDFLSDEAAHSSEFNHELIWQGTVEVPDVFDIAGIRETCAVFIQGLLMGKSLTEPETTYRIGIERREMSDEERRLLGIPGDSDRIKYRCFRGGAAGIASEIGRYLSNHKCDISEAQLQQVREGLTGNDLKFFNIDFTMSRM